MRILGMVLIVIGVVTLLYGGISWTHREKVVDLGPVEVTQEQHERLPVPPIAGGVILAAGVALVVAGRRRTS